MIDTERATGYLHATLIEAIEASLAAAIQDVEDGRATAATVGATFAIKLDEKEGVIVEYTHKSTDTHKTTFAPRAGQLRLV